MASFLHRARREMRWEGSSFHLHGLLPSPPREMRWEDSACTRPNAHTPTSDEMRGGKKPEIEEEEENERRGLTSYSLTLAI